MKLGKRVLFGLLVLAGAPLVWADGDRIEIHQPLPSTGMVILTRGNGFAQGSGFLVSRDDRLFMTNHHVAQKGTAPEIVFPVYDNQQVFIRRDFYLKKAPRVKGKCLYSDSERDLAVIELESLPFDVSQVKLASRSAEVGEHTHLLGNPGKSDQVYVYGVGTVQKVEELKIRFDNGQSLSAKSVVLKTDGAQGPGASGGPVVNDRAELIGVISSGRDEGRVINLIDVTEVRIVLGDCLREQGTTALGRKDYNRAIELCGKALRYNPNDALAHNEMGTAYSFQDRYDDAVGSYTDAIRLAPKWARAYRNRASAHYFKKEYDKAVADCTEAVTLDPNYAQAFLARSRAYGKLGKTAEAKADHDKAIKLDSTLK